MPVPQVRTKATDKPRGAQPDAAPACTTTKAPTIKLLSRLNHTASALAVYASQPGLPSISHARLASGWRPAFTGRDLHPKGPLKVSVIVYITFPFPRLGLAQCTSTCTSNSVLYKYLYTKPDDAPPALAS